MEYKVIDRKKIILRKERTGNALVIIKTTGHELFLNKTGVLILEQIWNFNNTNELLGFLVNNYPKVTKEILSNDMETILHILEVYDIIELSIEKVEEMLEGEYTIRYINEKEYKKVSTFIYENFERNKYGLKSADCKEYYSAVNMRTNTMNNKEYYIVTFDTNENPIAVLGFIPPYANSKATVANINSLFLLDELKCERIIELVREMLKSVSKRVNLITKVRLNVLSEPDIDMREDVNHEKLTKAIKIFKELDFSVECELKKEYGEKTLVMFSKAI